MIVDSMGETEIVLNRESTRLVEEEALKNVNCYCVCVPILISTLLEMERIPYYWSSAQSVPSKEKQALNRS